MNQYVDLSALKLLIMKCLYYTNWDNEKTFITSSGTPYDTNTLVDIQYVAMGSSVATVTEIRKEILSNPCFEYISLTSLFPVTRSIVLYSHPIITDQNYVNDTIPIYLNTGSMIVCEAQNITNLCTLPLQMIECYKGYDCWNGTNSESNSVQSKSYTIKNGKPTIWADCLAKYTSDK